MTHKTQSAETFFRGVSDVSQPTSLFTLVFSQVTTWIFARPLTNAAILGFYSGIWGTLAYALYNLWLITGGLIVDSLRFRHRCGSVQEFLNDRFGRWGTLCYSVVIGIRLVSEVFANLLVIGGHPGIPFGERIGIGPGSMRVLSDSPRTMGQQTDGTCCCSPAAMASRPAGIV